MPFDIPKRAIYRDRSAYSVASAELVSDRFFTDQDALGRVLTGEFARRPLSESPVRPTLVVFPPPGLDHLLGLRQRGDQCAFRHSARKVPLNDCTKALSVAFPD